MVGIGSGFHLQLPGKSKQRILHPAKVVELQDDTYTAEVEEQPLVVESGQDVLIYFEKNQKFMQQSAHIDPQVARWHRRYAMCRQQRLRDSGSR